ncbi:molybdenum cofactor guanylyltransferase MobA [Hydrogenimonas sp. SS33]|uniref:molybdenum cofactor guanylyltransferase MobA n=1 Tax=Hydrogenimonas leucolamina TaxID=2954236 RepID=UPI00336C1D91
MPFALPCVIFAGGRSSRMGRDKALLPFGGCATLAEYQFRRLSPLFPSLYISAKADKFPFKAPLIEDIPSEGGHAPTLGLLAAFGKLENDFFALSVDAPFVDAGVLETLFEVYGKEKADAYIARTPSGSHPMCGIYTRRMEPILSKAVAAGEHKLHRLLEQVNTRYVDFDDERLFYNMNRPGEYEEAMRIVSGKQ